MSIRANMEIFKISKKFIFRGLQKSQLPTQVIARALFHNAICRFEFSEEKGKMEGKNVTFPSLSLNFRELYCWKNEREMRA
ncbi:hypothetical protein CEXT_272811 [Caerostris extrusa]|uniref:Uncharacterized protein n=1 Tax=Caerostris extrusa TaxID=172846 RepID=A0AAV4MAU1_CAEEX|nr:hypothetical protein CEXT_272811 [Caerostris extrusa]